MNFDIINFLEDHNIPYDNNKEWANTQCPFCLDTEYHLGIHLTQGSINCWKCGTHKLPELIKQITEENPYEIIKKYKKGKNEESISPTYSQTYRENDKNRNEVRLHEPISWPIGTCNLPTRHRSYLINRGFNPKELERDWKVSKGTEGIGDYKFRIMIPIYHEGELVSYQGRDITGKQKDKYKTCYGTNIKDYLYGLDYVVTNDKVIITEGVTDVWRLGKGNAVATFGINFTMKQVRLIIHLIINKRIKRVGILFDDGEEAHQQALILQACLHNFIPDVYVLSLPDGKDPADLNKKQIKKILNF